MTTGENIQSEETATNAAVVFDMNEAQKKALEREKKVRSLYSGAFNDESFNHLNAIYAINLLLKNDGQLPIDFKIQNGTELLEGKQAVVYLLEQATELISNIEKQNEAIKNSNNTSKRALKTNALNKTNNHAVLSELMLTVEALEKHINEKQYTDIYVDTLKQRIQQNGITPEDVIKARSKFEFKRGNADALAKRVEGSKPLEQGPLVKNIFTKQYEELVKGFLDNSEYTYQVLEMNNNKIGIINMNGKFYNLNDIMKYANLNHLEFTPEDKEKYVNRLGDTNIKKTFPPITWVDDKQQVYAKNHDSITAMDEQFLANNPELNAISKAERMALNIYTGSFYSNSNNLIRGTMPLQNKQDFLPELIINTGMISSGLNGLNQGKPVSTFRTEFKLPKEVLEKRNKLATSKEGIDNDAIISTAIDKPLEIPDFGAFNDLLGDEYPYVGVVFHNVQGADLRGLSQKPFESEFTLAPGQIQYQGALDVQGGKIFVATPVATLTGLKEKARQYQEAKNVVPPEDEIVVKNNILSRLSDLNAKINALNTIEPKQYLKLLAALDNECQIAYNKDFKNQTHKTEIAAAMRNVLNNINHKPHPEDPSTANLKKQISIFEVSHVLDKKLANSQMEPKFKQKKLAKKNRKLMAGATAGVIATGLTVGIAVVPIGVGIASALALKKMNEQKQKGSNKTDEPNNKDEPQAGRRISRRRISLKRIRPINDKNPLEKFIHKTLRGNPRDTNNTAKQFATELKQINLELLGKITREEFNQKNFDKDEKVAPNIVGFIKNGNKIQDIVTADLLCAKSAAHQQAIFDFYLEVAKNCKEMKDYTSVFAIVAGLESSFASRLIDKKNYDRNEFKEFKELLVPMNNFKNIRDAIDNDKNHGENYVPYMGIYSKDMESLKGASGMDMDENTKNAAEAKVTAYKDNLFNELSRISHSNTAEPTPNSDMRGRIQRHEAKTDDELDKVSYAIKPKGKNASIDFTKAPKIKTFKNKTKSPTPIKQEPLSASSSTPTPVSVSDPTSSSAHEVQNNISSPQQLPPEPTVQTVPSVAPILAEGRLPAALRSQTMPMLPPIPVKQDGPSMFLTTLSNFTANNNTQSINHLLGLSLYHSQSPKAHRDKDWIPKDQEVEQVKKLLESIGPNIIDRYDDFMKSLPQQMSNQITVAEIDLKKRQGACLFAFNNAYQLMLHQKQNKITPEQTISSQENLSQTKPRAR
ncbi:RasGEF domain-containing protein [Candidatus Berkiella aquae]|uniref:RasGEF domain protein n=1 Tax=Candidatus Berkiella aquae TaxID=295108 RepID=A0A0Q9YPA7_9GAMM|nr:RasGEF domain-containing protein [Candidatus Berkiella aquae]MCS5711996.1 hypothetical protein [Candidatus Berkiella aquae]